MQQSLERLLFRNYEVVVANDGQQGIEVAEQEQPDLILMDISLPVMDGWEATERIRKIESIKNVPIIALTAHALVEDRNRSLAIGCNDFETKPINFFSTYYENQFSIRQEPKVVKGVSMIKPKALIVDDDEMLATFFTAAFEDVGYDVQTVLDGQEALLYLAEHTPHVVVLDLQLPHVSGEELLKFIKSEDRFATTWVFATSIEGTRVGYLHETADIVLTKPVEYQQVVQLATRVQSA